MPCLVWLPDPDGNAFWGGSLHLPAWGGALGASLLDGAMVLTAGVLIIFLGSSIRWYLLDVRPRTPRTDRQWIEALRTQPTVRFDGSMATIHGVRDFSWHTSRSFDARWFDASYDLDQITEIRISRLGVLEIPRVGTYDVGLPLRERALPDLLLRGAM